MTELKGNLNYPELSFVNFETYKRAQILQLVTLRDEHDLAISSLSLGTHRTLGQDGLGVHFGIGVPNSSPNQVKSIKTVICCI